MAAGGHDDARRVFRILPELHHRARNAHHRAYQQAAEREIDERRGGQRDDDGNAENIQGVGAQRRLQRRLRHDDLNEVVRVVADAAEHADGAAVRREEHGDAIADLLEPQRDALPQTFRLLPQVIVGVDGHLRIDGQHQAAYALPARGNRLHLRRAQHLGAQTGGNVAAGEAFGGKGRELRRGEAFVQPVDAEGRDRWQEDQHLGEKNENTRQHQEL